MLEVQALLDLAHARGIDTDTIKGQAFELTRNGTDHDYQEATREALQSAIEASNGHRGETAGDEGAARGETEGLTSPTLEDVLAQQDRKAQGDKAKYKSDHEAD